MQQYKLLDTEGFVRAIDH